MICAVCQKETGSIIVDGRSVCVVCHTPLATSFADSQAPKVMTDLGRRPSVAGNTPSAAEALHNRVKSAHVIDLREAKAMAAEVKAETAPEPAAHTPEPRARVTAGAGAHERHIAQFTDRFERSRKFSRSAQISRFGVDRFGHIQDPAKMYDKFGNPTLQTLETHVNSAPSPAPETHPQMPHQAITQHQALTKLGSPQPHMAPAPAASRMLAAGTAVVIMAGYIWFQNYPKLALQSADSRAGIAATLPSFMPSSYTLASTSSSPGQVTLKFTSPSSTEDLTIAQHRTSWDSSSLLENYVSQATDAYAAVDGQGLTIYMFGANQASWVNHGIWYSIEGAARLSRSQILQIAYSL